MIVDFQAHVFPPAYLDALQHLNGNVVLEPPDPYSGMRYLYDKRLGRRINTATLQGQDPHVRLRHMDELRIDVQVVSIPPPGADRFDPEDAIAIARVANDALGELCAVDADRLLGLYTLPTASIPAALDEIERATHELGLRGFGCYTNLDGRALDDESLFPLYERIAALGQPIYVHPTVPLATEATGLDIMPVLIYGWAFDASVAMTRLVYGRVIDRFPEINWVVADVGGVLPFFAQRAINIYTGRTDEIHARYGLKENPLDQLRRFYVDTADHPAATLRCALDFFGPDRLVFGTNYPYGPDEGRRFVRNCLDAVAGLGLAADDTSKILGGNAAQVLGLMAGTAR
jgi:predicted TIM-barrel fold metal-dependent hydrolase